MNPIKASPHYTLSKLMDMVEETIRKSFKNDEYWVKAEISTFAIAPSGYGRFEFVEKDPLNANSLATVKGICWKNSIGRIMENFYEVTGESLRANIKVLVKASISFDKRYGLTLDVKDIDPSYTLGEVEKAKQQVIKKLKEDGDYFLNKRLDFPIVFQKIALISASDSKGREDFENILIKNPYGFEYKCILFEAKLAGETAANDIKKRIIQIYRSNEELKAEFDCIVIIRGGGASMECFNEYQLARAVSRVPIPVFAGIGHTTNKSIVDEVAAKSFITPTDAANFIVERTADFYRKLNNFADKLVDYTEDFFENENQYLVHLKTQIEINSLKLIHQENQNLYHFSSQIDKSVQNKLKTINLNISEAEWKLKQKSENYIQNKNQKLNYFGLQINLGLKYLLKSKKLEINTLENKVNLLDPINILKRGFSIASINGKIIKNIEEIEEGQAIETTFYNGKTISIIKEINKNNG